MTLGQRIKEERIKQGISMNKLAKSVGIAQSGLSDLEAGKRQVSFETAIKLIEALGFKPNEFFSNKQPAQSPEIIQLIKSVEKSLVDALLSTLSGKVVESALSFLPW